MRDAFGFGDGKLPVGYVFANDGAVVPVELAGPAWCEEHCGNRDDCEHVHVDRATRYFARV
jgi:hypothetical protein